MKVENSKLAPFVTKKVQNCIGSVHFFEHLAVMEFDEGVHIDIKLFKDTILNLKDHFGEKKPFGLIANRVNSYSISLLDLQYVRPMLPNLEAYAVVAYNEAGRMNAEIENKFCSSQNICFNDLYESLHNVDRRVKEKITFSLN